MTKKVRKQKSEVTPTRKVLDHIPYKCYSCHEYDGTFGPDNDDQHTHVCAECKELPAKLEVIPEHFLEYQEHLKVEGDEAKHLRCPNCDRERDTCQCEDNPLFRKQKTRRESPPKEVFDIQMDNRIHVFNPNIQRIVRN